MSLFNIFADVANAFKSVCDTVSKVGTAVANFAHEIKPVLGPILNTIALYAPHPAVKAVAGFANALLQGLSIFRPDESVQGMGDKALQAADQGVTQDKFENFDEYMSELRNFEVTPEGSEKYSAVDKLVAGLGVATSGLEDKFNAAQGSLNGLWLLPLTNSEYFTPERVKSLLESGKSIGDVSAYLEKRMSGAEASEFRKNYEFTSEGKPMNDAELGTLYSALDSARAELASLKQQIKDNA